MPQHSFSSFARSKQFLEVKEQVLDADARSREAGRAARARQQVRKLDETRGDPSTYYVPFDHRMKVDYTPQHARHSQNVTLQDLLFVVQSVCAQLPAQCEVVRMLGEEGFIVAVSVVAGNFQGRPFPAMSAVEAALIKAMRETYPVAVVDKIDEDQISGLDPSLFRRRGFFRVRKAPGRGAAF